MQQILLAVQVLVAVGLIVLVLLQQGRGADAGASFGGGASGSLFGSRGPASFLAKMTGLLAAVFFINSLGLAYLAAEASRARSVVERIEQGSDTEVPALPVDAASTESEVPASPDSSDSGVPSAPTTKDN